MKDIGDIKPLKPYKPFKDEPDPSKQDIVCNYCGSTMKSPDPLKNEGTAGVCPNCGKSNTEEVIGFHDRTPDKPGKQYNPFSTNNPMYTERGGPLVMAPASSKNNVKISQKIKKVKLPRVNEYYKSEEFKQMDNPTEYSGRKYKKKNDTYNVDEINNTCNDLAIDG